MIQNLIILLLIIIIFYILSLKDENNNSSNCQTILYDCNDILNENNNEELDKLSKNEDKPIDLENGYNLQNLNNLNDNIIIHKKFKNELLESNNEKQKQIQKYKDNLKKQLHKRKKIIKQESEIEINSQMENMLNIIPKYNDIHSLNLELKQVFITFDNAFNENKLHSSDAKNIINKLQNELETLEYNMSFIKKNKYHNITTYYKYYQLNKIGIEKKIKFYSLYISK